MEGPVRVETSSDRDGLHNTYSPTSGADIDRSYIDKGVADIKEMLAQEAEKSVADTEQRTVVGQDSADTYISQLKAEGNGNLRTSATAQGIRDLVGVDGDRSFTRGAGNTKFEQHKFLSNYEISQIAAHEELIREGLHERKIENIERALEAAEAGNAEALFELADERGYGPRRMRKLLEMELATLQVEQTSFIDRLKDKIPSLGRVRQEVGAMRDGLREYGVRRETAKTMKRFDYEARQEGYREQALGELGDTAADDSIEQRVKELEAEYKKEQDAKQKQNIFKASLEGFRKAATSKIERNDYADDSEYKKALWARRFRRLGATVAVAGVIVPVTAVVARAIGAGGDIIDGTDFAMDSVELDAPEGGDVVDSGIESFEGGEVETFVYDASNDLAYSDDKLTSGAFRTPIDFDPNAADAAEQFTADMLEGWETTPTSLAAFHGITQLDIVGGQDIGDLNTDGVNTLADSMKAEDGQQMWSETFSKMEGVLNGDTFVTPEGHEASLSFNVVQGSEIDGDIYSLWMDSEGNIMQERLSPYGKGNHYLEITANYVDEYGNEQSRVIGYQDPQCENLCVAGHSFTAAIPEQPQPHVPKSPVVPEAPVVPETPETPEPEPEPTPEPTPKPEPEPEPTPGPEVPTPEPEPEEPVVPEEPVDTEPPVDDSKKWEDGVRPPEGLDPDSVVADPEDITGDPLEVGNGTESDNMDSGVNPGDQVSGIIEDGASEATNDNAPTVEEGANGDSDANRTPEDAANRQEQQEQQTEQDAADAGDLTGTADQDAAAEQVRQQIIAEAQQEAAGAAAELATTAPAPVQAAGLAPASTEPPSASSAPAPTEAVSAPVASAPVAVPGLDPAVNPQEQSMSGPDVAIPPQPENQ